MLLFLWVQPHALTQIAQMIMPFNILNKNNPYFMQARPKKLIGFCCYDICTLCVLLFFLFDFGCRVLLSDAVTVSYIHKHLQIHPYCTYKYKYCVVGCRVTHAM